MARFYKTATPDFVDDFMYQPPWELIEKAMTFNEEGIQNALETTKLFDYLEVPHLNDPVVNTKVEELKNKYSGTADTIASNIQSEIATNPQAWKKYIPEIENLQTNFQKDYLAGDLAKIRKDYENRLAFEELNKDVKEKNPTLYYAALNAINSNWASDPNRESEWVGERLSDFDINSKEIVDGLKDFQAEIQTRVQNGYITETKYKDPNAIAKDYMTRVFSDPKAQQFLQQAIKYKLPGFVDEKGDPIPPKIIVDNKTGKTISQEEFEAERERYESLSDEERAKQGKSMLNYSEVLNPEFAWSKTFSNVGNRLGGIISQTVKADPVQAKREQRAWEEKKMGLQHQYNLELEAAKVNAKKEEKRLEEEKKRAEEISKLQDQLRNMDPDSKGAKKIQDQINDLRNQNLKSLQQVYVETSLEEVSRVLNAADKNTPDYILKRNLDNNILADAVQDLGLGTVKNIGTDENGNPILDFIPTGKNAAIIIDTYRAFNDKLGSDGFKSKREKEEAIKNYLVEVKGISRDKLEEIIEISPAKSVSVGSIVPVGSTTQKYNTDYFKKIMDGIENITEAKKDRFSDYSQTSISVEFLPITESFGEDLRGTFLNNSGNYLVKKVQHSKDEKDESTPEILDILNEGDINHVTNKSPWGEATIINYNGEDYFIVNNEGYNNARIKNQALYDHPSGYVNEDDYLNMKNTANSAFLSAIMNNLAEVSKLIETGTVFEDYINKKANGSPSRFTQIQIPLVEGEAANIRYYVDTDKEYRFSLVNNDGESLDSFKTMDELSETLMEYVIGLYDFDSNTNVDTDLFR